MTLISARSIIGWPKATTIHCLLQHSGLPVHVILLLFHLSFSTHCCRRFSPSPPRHLTGHLMSLPHLSNIVALHDYIVSQVSNKEVVFFTANCLTFLFWTPFKLIHRQSVDINIKSPVCKLFSASWKKKPPYMLFVWNSERLNLWMFGLKNIKLISPRCIQHTST